MRLEHINITVSDIDKSLEWAKVVWPKSKVRHRATSVGANGEFEWVHFGDNEFYVAFQSPNKKVPYYKNPHVKDFYMHFGFEVNDVKHIKDALESLGYTANYADDIQTRKRLYFLDPDGHYFEFVQYCTENSDLRNEYQ
ncbi:VOC family protein [Exilibacterium tricleocarpae]|uniref:VOC family protein n=1 Tax=Exilibacterium tricleocarpae TaxID=2591008 RepID=A0A545SRQ3_9GAMM|nr:VOC family protein [Exilibacterium tricleocarpae]TQV67660.1 VOC family protein [Exilibacterium tricleocarpae]